MKNIISTEKAPAAIGPYSQGIAAKGETVYLSGQIAINPKTGNIESDDIRLQAEQTLKNVGALLEKAGLSFSDVVKTTCFITDMLDFSAFNEVYARYFKEDAPARSCVAVKELPKSAKCEIEVVAVK